jgi:hypothetical protein
MGVCTFLVSDDKEEFFDFGKVFLDEEIIERLEDEALPRDPDERASARVQLLVSWFGETDGEFNSLELDAIDEIAARAVEWMRGHADWRFVTDADDDFAEDCYLAVDDEDARDYAAEFGGDTPIYKKTGEI